MKTRPFALAQSIVLSALAFPPVSRAEHIVTLGDSLTFAYEAEFGFQYNLGAGPVGDGFGPEVRNWAEILNDPNYRNSSFDLGSPRDIALGPFTLLFRQDFNWAIPGLKVDQLRRFITGTDGFLDLIGENSEFSVLTQALGLSDFDEAVDFDLTGMEDQISNDAARLSLFIGGNDLRGVYGPIYNGNGAGSFVADFIADITAILDRVETLNPNIQVVLVNVPHIGITPLIRDDFPTDPVRTGRVTAVVRDLNQQLRTLASSRGIGYADVFTPTLPLLDEPTLCIQGITFENSGSTSGDSDFVWLNGSLSRNFHPNTNAQAVIANEIIHAFNRTYGTGIAPLSATEILDDLIGKPAGDLDMTFTQWMTRNGLDGLSATDDSDGDSVPAGLEFATGLDPRRNDSEFISSSVTEIGGSGALQLSFPVRLPTSSNFSLTAAASADLSVPFSAVSATAGADGLSRAEIPLNARAGFMRLEVSGVGP